ncbi:MAG: AAA family ATPase [Bacteroidota bacterium]|nr:AAA family ATPase [Bacteroidota bacterium]
MIPVSLTIKGLYSYQQETYIDFTKLTEAGLFGIFGAVGSGKSTILEALSFALYGETERLNKNDKRSYNMMNLKSKNLRIDFIFTCGDCDHKYKFTVSARRNSKHFGDGGKIERLAYVWENSWIPTELNAEKILGLSYDNFKRTIIIPQGKFQEFLQLKDTERVQMLKEIFSLEKFELSPRVAALSKENELKVSNLHGQMQALPLNDEQLLNEKQTQLKELEIAVGELTENLQNNQFEEKRLQDLKTLFADVKLKKTALESLQIKEPAINESDRQIREFEKCEQIFKFPISNRDRLVESITKQQVEAKKLHAEKTRLASAIETQTSEVLRFKDSYGSRELLLQRAGELEKMVTIKSISQNIATLSSRIEKGDKAVKDEEESLTRNKEQLQAIKTQITLAEQSLPNTALLVSVNNWFKANNELLVQLKKTEHEVEELSKSVIKTKNEIETGLSQLPADINFTSFPKTFPVVTAAFSLLENTYNVQLQTLKDEQNHLKVYQKLDEFSQSLVDDSECPLCGSRHHPKVFSVTNATRDIKQKQKTIDDIEASKKRLGNTLLDLSSLYSSFEMFTNQLYHKHQELARQKDKLILYRAQFSFAGYTVEDEAVVAQQLLGIETTTNAIKKLQLQRDQLDKQSDEAAKNIATYKGGIEKIRTQKAEHEGQLETLRAQIVLHKAEAEMNETVAVLQSNAESLKLQYAQVTKNFERADKLLQESSKNLATLSGRIEELVKQLYASEDELKEVNESVRALLISEGYPSEQAVKQVLETKRDIKKEKDIVETFKRALHAATIQFGEAIARIEGEAYNEEVHLRLQQEIQMLLKDLADKTGKLVTDKFELAELKQRMEARLILQKELDKLNLRAENLKVLSNLFRASGFVNFVSSVYLQNLVNAANQRFYKMTRQKLLLELAEDNAFRVRDFLNNGEVRSVKTLSGGQTFQAALALALALADNIQHLTKSKQNFFFLDEGFGSLDKESLAIVFDTLKGLRKENRIVGVISHVDEMQQEIPVNLKIVNDIERGSLVSKSWN